MRTAGQRAGDMAEAAVAADLVRAGWTILGRQVRTGRLEVDIVAIDPAPPPAFVIVEVRYRRRRDFGLGEETVGHAKRVRLREAAARLRSAGVLRDGTPLPRLPLRIDLVVVEPGRAGGLVMRHHRGAL